ncbi:helix-turn-helix domain-containing protein [Mesorhizobium sp.]|uniref:helix-turn-helix domain-containing protein n=1 Tax=Mesorhizobium sp. TaxID=1871066 RepID=UPI00257C6EA2|nr:helix-turn-helix domain-containing protein [Mesorhizobium sp.]
MSDAAARLGVSHVNIRRFIRDGILPAEKVMRCAPYQIRASDLEDDRIKAELARKARLAPKTTIRNRCFPPFEKGCIMNRSSLSEESPGCSAVPIAADSALPFSTA